MIVIGGQKHGFQDDPLSVVFVILWFICNRGPLRVLWLSYCSYLRAPVFVLLFCHLQNKWHVSLLLHKDKFVDITFEKLTSGDINANLHGRKRTYKLCNKTLTQHFDLQHQYCVNCRNIPSFTLRQIKTPWQSQNGQNKLSTKFKGNHLRSQIWGHLLKTGQNYLFGGRENLRLGQVSWYANKSFHDDFCCSYYMSDGIGNAYVSPMQVLLSKQKVKPQVVLTVELWSYLNFGSKG